MSQTSTTSSFGSGRRLPKRALELPGDAVRESPVASWFYTRPELRAALERYLCEELELPAGSVFVDYPEKPRMMGLDLLLLQRDGSIVRLAESGHAGLIDLPRIADGLYHSARVFRVLTMERRELSASLVLDLLAKPVEELEVLLGSERTVAGGVPR